jgi:hypothetical protein
MSNRDPNPDDGDPDPQACRDQRKPTPNKQTKQAIKDARTRKNFKTFVSVAAWAKSVRST